MSDCVFPGSFDPVTTGHMDIIRRASCIFDHVTVVVMINIRKQGTIPIDKRVAILRKACRDLSNVEIDFWDGLLAEYMRIHQKTIVIRGARSSSEFEQECISASVNRLLNDSFETIFMPAYGKNEAVSSSAVREIAGFGGDITHLVPKELTEEIVSLLSKE